MTVPAWTTKGDAGREILRASGLAIIPAENLADAADKIVSAVAQGGAAK